MVRRRPPVRAACRKTRRSFCSSEARTCRSPTAACPITSAERSASGASCWSSSRSCCNRASGSTSGSAPRSRPSTAQPRPSVSATSLQGGSTKSRTTSSILAPGAAPLRPPIPGIDLAGIFTLRNLQDMDRIKEQVDQGVKQAVVVGAGFIGLELVENLVRRGVATTVVELQDQVLPPFDKEMTTPLVEHLAAKGVTVRLGESAEAFEPGPDGLTVVLKSGIRLPAQLVVLGIGVRPENKLAVRCRTGNRASRRHQGQWTSSNQRPGHLCGRRRHRSQ